MTNDINSNDENTNRVEDTKPNLVNPGNAELRSTSQDIHPGLSSGTNLYSLESDITNELRSRWTSIQAQFVDQPCTSIEQADALVADALERIQNRLTLKHNALRERWYDHEDVSTEDLRITLQDYRAFLNNLLDQK